MLPILWRLVLCCRTLKQWLPVALNRSHRTHDLLLLPGCLLRLRQTSKHISKCEQQYKINIYHFMFFKSSDMAEDWHMNKQRISCFSSNHRAEMDIAFYEVGLTHNAWVCFMKALAIKLLYLCHQHFIQFTYKNLFHSGKTSTCYKPRSPTWFHRVHHFNAIIATCVYKQVHTSPGGLQQNMTL
jgi:hypothetical protein